ncbi:MAG: hypothetical protein OXB97_11150 [Rhodospirillales bacterium]|nr:hypothetical protein [Rhodospirillales bacterium]
MTIGFHPDDGDPLEVFLRPASARSGSDLQFLADDAAIILSLCLQYGVPIDVIGKSLSRQQGYRPASLLAAVADHLALIEKGG